MLYVTKAKKFGMTAIMGFLIGLIMVFFGNGYLTDVYKRQFNKFTNLPELMNIFREVADVQTADMLELDVPALRGGKPAVRK